MLLRLVEAQNRVQWDTFTVQNEYATRVAMPVWGMMITDKMADMMLSFRQWSGIRYLDNNGEYQIGYGYGDPDKQQGFTEVEAYAEWRGALRNAQRVLNAQIPLKLIPQAAFDALMSLYIDTGTWRTVEADEGTYDLADAVKNSNWLLCADILSRGNVNPDMRRREANTLYLGNYTAGKDRNQQITQGIFQLRKAYVDGIPNEFEKLQAEFVYYRQFGSFLPGMSDLRQRRIIAQVN